MIVDSILGFFSALLGTLIDFLPSGTFPLDVDEEAAPLEFIADLDYLVPFVTPVRWFVTILGTTLAGLLAYRFGLFIYNRIRG